jgi:DnaJ-class molecular chaperone
MLAGPWQAVKGLDNIHIKFPPLKVDTLCRLAYNLSMAGKSYYDILGVSRSASEKEMRQAFRRLARKHHPDVNPGDKEAEGRFKEINRAYEVLSDAEKRRKYDRFGEQWEQAEGVTCSGAPPAAAAALSRTSSSRFSAVAGPRGARTWSTPPRSPWRRPSTAPPVV